MFELLQRLTSANTGQGCISEPGVLGTAVHGAFVLGLTSSVYLASCIVASEITGPGTGPGTRMNLHMVGRS